MTTTKNERELKRPFPMLDGPPIEWSEAEAVYQLYVCLFGRSQSLQTIANRGGFGHEEIKAITKKHESEKARGQCCCSPTPSSRKE